MDRPWVVEYFMYDDWCAVCGKATMANAKMIAEALMAAGFSTRARIRNVETGEIVEVK